MVITWKYLCIVFVVIVLNEKQVHGISSCPGHADFELWNGYCYFFADTSSYYTYSTAKAACENMGATLTSIMSEQENEYIFNKYENDWMASSVWIGLIKDSDVKPVLEDNYYWIDGSEMVYKKWAPYEPNGGLGVEDCTEMYTSSYYTPSAWNDVPCQYHNKDSYICKVQADERWEKLNNFEYYISHKAADVALNWYDARQICMDKGGDLASLKSLDETDQIFKWAKINNYIGDLWIGANRLNGDRKTWSWSDKSSWSYTNWKSGYPDDNNFGHHCAYAESMDDQGKWMNGHCDIANKGFICARPAGVDPTPKTDPVTEPYPGYCPAGFVDAGNKCFMVTPLPFSAGYSFSDALNFCRQQAGYQPDLASITSEYEQAVITSQLQDRTAGVVGLWIGLYRTSSHLEWRWTDSSPRSYDNWGPGEPSSNTEHCTEVWFRRSELGKWNDIPCDRTRGYVCETYKNKNSPIVTPPITTPHSCPTGFTPYWNGCYKYVEKGMPWADALTNCKTLDSKATLVGIHYEAENSALQSVLMDKGTDVWTGFKYDSVKGEYEWQDGWSSIRFVKWAVGQPARENDQAGCIRLSRDGTWTDTLCDRLLPSICKILTIDPLTTPATLPGRCPPGDGWEEYHEHCYYYDPYNAVVWDEAKEMCQGLAPFATLVSIHSDVENNHIYSRLKDRGNPSVWLGMYRSKQDKSFRWMDASTVQFTAWAPGEPNGEENGEDCIEMFNHVWPGLWNDHSCYDRKGFVCKGPKLPDVTAPTPSDRCPEGWVYLEKKCFLFLPDAKVNNQYAQDKCQEMGGESASLASIHGFFENRLFVEEMKLRSDLPQRTNFYIGMAKTSAGEPYLWTDGSEVDFVNWAPFEPNDKDGNRENCVEVNIESGRWNDISCGEIRGLVCKLPETSGLSGGDVAGIVIGTLLGLMVLFAVIGFILIHQGIIEDPTKRFRNTGTPFQNE